MTGAEAAAAAAAEAGAVFDVVVVGYGPSGAIAAALLGAHGLHTLVVERQTAVYEKPRAIAIDHEILRVLQSVGLAETVLEHTAPFRVSEYFGASGQLIKRIDMVPPPYPMGYTPNLVFTQPPVEAALRAHVAGLDSVEVALGVSLVSIAQDEAQVTLALEDERGARREVRARYVIGCDGAGSFVRREMGLRYEDLGFDEPWLVVDMLVGESGLAKLPRTAVQYCDPSRPSSFLIGPGNHRRWEIALNPGEDPRECEQPDEVWRLLSPWLGREDATLWRSASYRFHALVADRWREGRVFIAGDAAHQQPPFIGQGMCQGVRDVANLAWKLESVLRGRSDPSLLDSYATERRAHVRELTTRIKAIGRVIGERDPEAARARDLRLLAEGGGQAATTTRQEIVPPLQAGFLSASPHAANGTLFPQPEVHGATGRDLLDRVAGGGWRLVLDLSRIEEPDATAQGPAPLRVVGLAPDGEAGSPAVLRVRETGRILADWFARNEAAAALVRPDHYVFGAATDQAGVAQLLREASAFQTKAGPATRNDERYDAPSEAFSGAS